EKDRDRSSPHPHCGGPLLVGITSPLRLFVALCERPPPFWYPSQPAVAVGRLVGVVLIEAGVHPRLSRRLFRIFRRNRRGKYGISRGLRRRGRGGGRRSGGGRRPAGWGSSGRIGPTLRFTEIAPCLSTERARGFGLLVLGTALLHGERLHRLRKTHQHRAGDHHEACGRRNVTH